MDSVNLLITGVGAPGTLGTLESLKQLPFPYKCIGTDLESQTANQLLFDTFYPVPPPEDAAFIDTIRDIVTQEKINILLPQVTRELSPLADHKDMFVQLGCHVLVNDREKIKILNNKYRLMQHIQQLGFPVPEHRWVNSKTALQEAAHRLGYPNKKVIVKPPVSNGMRGLRILTESSDQVADFLNKKPDSAQCSLHNLLTIFPNETLPDLLVCEYLPGTEVSVDCLCKDGEPVLILPRTRDKIRSGITFAGTTVCDNVIINQCVEIIQSLGLDHIVGFQFKYNTQGYPLILESNPRIQGTMVLGAFCQANVIAGAVSQALGYPFESTQAGIHWGVQLSRYWGGIVHKNHRLIGKF